MSAVAAGVLVATLVGIQAPTKIMLQRLFREGESQGYTFFIKGDTQAGEVRIEGEFSQTVKKALEGGNGEIEFGLSKVKVTFGGEEMPSDQMPKPEVREYTKFGLPKAFDEDDDMLSIPIVLAGYLPAAEVEVGGIFPIKWESADGKFKLDGEGKLVATGRLYEERVAKIQLNMKVTPKDDVPGELVVTSYVNLETGKIVRAEGEASSESEGVRMTANFEVKKVRS